MGNVTLIFKAVLLDQQAIQHLTNPDNHWRLLSAFITFLLGIVYGFTSITINREIILSFETPLLRDAVVPAIFLFFGIFMIFVTKIGLALLLWAGSKGLKGQGHLAILYRNTSVALIPSVIALPAFISIQVGNPLSFVMIASVAIAIVWIYLICSKVVEETQQFVQWKAYAAVLLAFVFFVSIYYIILPPAVS